MKEEEQETLSVRVPREGELLGRVVQLSVATHLKVMCSDGMERICRIPGKLRKRIWIRENDVVIVKPWEFQKNERGDVIWRYTKTQSNWLKKRGYLRGL